MSSCWHSLDSMDPCQTYKTTKMDPCFPMSASRHSLDSMDPCQTYKTTKMDPYFPMSSCWHSLEIMDPLLNTYLKKKFYQLKNSLKVKTGSSVSNECQQALIGNHGSM